MNIKSTSLKFILLSAITIFTVSCHNDDDSFIPFVNVWPEEDPLPGYMQTTQFYQDTNLYLDKVPEEIGFAFKPSVKGNLTALMIKMPDTCNNVRVTIWDKATATAIRTENVTIAVKEVNTAYPIETLELEKDKHYAITMNTGDWYNRRRFDISAMPFPVTSGNIIITGSGFGPGDGQVMPENLSRTNYYDGDISFKFRRTE